MSEELKHTAGVTFNPDTLELHSTDGLPLGRAYATWDNVFFYKKISTDPDKMKRFNAQALANGVLWAASSDLLAACQSSEQDAQDIADTLERWANELRHGSFASHLVGPMQTMVDGLRHNPSRRKAIANATTAPAGGQP